MRFNTHDLVSQYEKMISDDAHDIKKDIIDGTLSDDDAVNERINEESESAVIYTMDAWMICACSNNADAHETELGTPPVNVESQAYMAYQADLRAGCVQIGASHEELVTERAAYLVGKMTREKCVEVLEDVDPASDGETVEVLRAAIVENVEDGTINVEDLS